MFVDFSKDTVIASWLIILIHVLVLATVVRFVFHNRITTMRRFVHDVNSGRFQVTGYASTDDPFYGGWREGIFGHTPTGDFDIIMVVDRRNGLCAYSLRIGEQYYASWRVRQDGPTRLATLYRLLRPA